MKSASTQKPKPKRSRVTGNPTGRPSGYDSKVHDESILQYLSNGDFVEDFCKRWDITQKTYRNWSEVNPSFKEAIQRGKQYGKAVWLRKPLERQENAFSHKYWSIIMNNVYQWGTEKAKKLINPMHPKEIIDTTIGLLSRGRITGRMADRYNALAMSKLRIIETDELERRIENLESIAKKR